jgi:3-oxoacyl-[acyl-carrier protein] reductase
VVLFSYESSYKAEKKVPIQYDTFGCTMNQTSDIPGPANPGSRDNIISSLPDASQVFLGKVAVITGAGRGIGRGIALELGKRGATVVVNYAHNTSAAEAVAEELAALGAPKGSVIQADISKPQQVVDLFEQTMLRHGHIDIVVSNAGMESWCEEEHVSPDLFDRVFALNCRGQFFVAQQAMRHCLRGGRLILTSSVAATMTGISDHALYAGSKAAVEGFARAFSVDCGAKGITVNAIAPGGVKTDMYDKNSWHYVPGGYEGMPMEVIDRGLANLCPLKRVGVPADIGKAVVTLCLPESEWINGKEPLYTILNHEF